MSTVRRKISGGAGFFDVANNGFYFELPRYDANTYYGYLITIIRQDGYHVVDNWPVSQPALDIGPTFYTSWALSPGTYSAKVVLDKKTGDDSTVMDDVDSYYNTIWYKVGTTAPTQSNRTITANPSSIYASFAATGDNNYNGIKNMAVALVLASDGTTEVTKSEYNQALTLYEDYYYYASNSATTSATLTPPTTGNYRVKFYAVDGIGNAVSYVDPTIYRVVIPKRKFPFTLQTKRKFPAIKYSSRRLPD